MGTFVGNVEYVTINCGPKDTGGCGMQFAVTREFYDETNRTGAGWFCPRGHSRVWGGDTTEEQLRKAEARLVSAQDQLRAAVHEGEEVRKALLRDRHRFANGVCPCCNRSFEALARHMATQHPDYDITQVRTPREPAFRCSCGSSFETPRGLAIHQGHSRRGGWDDPAASQWRAHLTVVIP